jgi:hypothetical protein
MVSPLYLLIFAGIVLIGVFIYVWWKRGGNKDTKVVSVVNAVTEHGPPDTGVKQQALEPTPPMVFAVNDAGNLDLTDMNGRVLNKSYGPNPKTYIQLLDLVEKDTDKHEMEGGLFFSSKVGTTKRYEVGGRPYIINYTRL